MHGRSSLPPPSTGSWRPLPGAKGTGSCPWRTPRRAASGETLDGLSKYPLYITAEMYLPIHHNLASAVPLKDDPGHLRPPADPRAVQRQDRGMGRPGHPHEQQCGKRTGSAKGPQCRRHPLGSSSHALPAPRHRPFHREQCREHHPVRQDLKDPLARTRAGRSAASSSTRTRTGPVCSIDLLGGVCKAQHQPDADRVAAIKAGDRGICLLPRLCVDAR